MLATPQWTERIASKDVPGEDHLGIETAAINYQGDLLPGIITVTEHARYFSLYCWILWRFIQDDSQQHRLDALKDRYFKRLELAHTLACYAHHENSQPLHGVIGGQKFGVIWRSGDPVDLDTYGDYYFQNKLGGFGQYYVAAMQILGLIGEQPNRHDVYGLTERGVQLAEAFDESIRETLYYVALHSGPVTHLSHDDGRDYGDLACLCYEALAQGKDRKLLREVLFRLGDGRQRPQHYRRQLSLALLLDMVDQSEDEPFWKTLRYALYLGEYSPGHVYLPRPFLTETYTRWQHVQVRQLYTNALQILWRLFLDYLQGDDEALDGISLEQWMDHLERVLGSEALAVPLVERLQALLGELDLSGDWHEQAAVYAEQSRFRQDALTRFSLDLSSRHFTALDALDMLIDIFLRFYPCHLVPDDSWRTIAFSTEESHRLPLHDFFVALEAHLKTSDTTRDVLTWLYRRYILSQHEYMAIHKLRYNGYDTFKFHYHEGKFYRTGKTPWDQPLRHPALRLTNALTMLIDVGLVRQNNGMCALTYDGEIYLAQVEALHLEP